MKVYSQKAVLAITAFILEKVNYFIWLWIHT